MANNQIHTWMTLNVAYFVDECGEVNCTQMVEEWDSRFAGGEATLDSDHPAWDIAVKVAEEYEKHRS